MRFSRSILGFLLFSSLALLAQEKEKTGGEDLPDSVDQEVTKKHFDIPADTAEIALDRFARRVDDPLVYLLDQVKGVQLNAVQGTYTPGDAIHRLVDNTELNVVRDPSSGAWVITPKRLEENSSGTQPNSQPITTEQSTPMIPKGNLFNRTLTGLLSIFLVSASPQAAAQEENEIEELSPFEITEDSVLGYVSRESLAGSKTAEQIIDLPSMVNVVTTDFIEDTISYDRVIDVLRNSTPGIKSIGPRQPNYQIRGFRSRDHGIDGLAQRGLNRVPMSFIQSVEVLKGPSALMYGAFADVGGYVNRNLKWPFENRQTKAGVVVGSDNYMFGYIDTTGPIPGAEWIQYRFNAEYLDRDFPYNDGDYRKANAMRLALNFDISETSNLKLAVMRFHTDQVIQRGQLDPVTKESFFPISISEGTVSTAENQDHDWLTQLSYTNTPSEFFSFNIKYHYEANWQKTSFVRARDPWQFGLGAEAEAAGYTEADDRGYVFFRQGNINIPFGLNPDDDVDDADGPNRSTHQFETKFVWNYLPENLPFKSKFLFGFGYLLEQRDNDRYDTRTRGDVDYDNALANDQVTNSGGFFDMRDFEGAPMSYNPWWRQDANQDKGWVFYNERLSFFDDRLHLIYGQRYDYVEAERYRWPAGSPDAPVILNIPPDALEDTQYAAAPRTFSNVSDRYGLVAKPWENVSVFYGYSEAFQDQGPQALTGGGLAPPLISEGTDIGVKVDMLKGFTGTISFFNIDVTNRLIGDQDNPGFKILNPNVINSEGFEASLAYQYEGLTLLFNYYDGEAIDTDTNTLELNQFTKAWNAWVKYRFTQESAFSGLSLGLGVSYQNELVGRNGVFPPEATFVDAFVAYQMNENWRFRLAGSNINDEFSTGLIVDTYRTGYGRPKEFKFSVDYTF